MDMFPVEINSATYKELLRVPGIGKISARRIIESRKKDNCFKNLEDLKNIGVVTSTEQKLL